MAELLALLRGPNRASSSSTPPPGQGPTADPTPWVPQTQAPENVEVPAPSTPHTSVAHPFTSPCPPPPAPTAVPLPPATFLSSEHILSAPPPVSILAPAMAYTIPPPTDSLSGSALDWFMSLKAEDIPTWEDLSRKFTDQYRYCAETPPTLLELSTKEMARGQKFEDPTGTTADDLTVIRPLCACPRSTLSTQAPGVENSSTGATEPHFAWTSRPRTLRPVTAFRTSRPLYCFQDFAAPDFASGYCFSDNASTLLLSGIRVPGLCVRLLLSGLRVHFTAFRTSRPRTLRPVTAFRTTRPLYYFQEFASPDFASDGPPKWAYRHAGTTRVGEQALDDLPELDSVSRGTFQWSRTSLGEPSGHFHGKQRSQRSPSTSLLCAPEFHLVGARMRAPKQTRLGSIHLPGDARRTRVRRSRHLLFTTRRSRAVESPGSRGTGYT
ncbi:hypothetical protein CRG98_001889 [Punica granatum]|uniref:Retrotransposon gag domain-containing protein n=1 Tax=Punica granatum TaxID=22663 RepID=A0A2I0LAK6_PUNGR|nr:hypothetical protein CRG98_001889 [Punica granatum]